MCHLLFFLNRMEVDDIVTVVTKVKKMEMDI